MADLSDVATRAPTGTNGPEPSARPGSNDPTVELDRLRQRLHLIGIATGVGIWEYDFRSDELWVSDELAGLYGVRPNDLTWEEFVSRLHPDDRVTQLERPTPSSFGQVNEFLFRVRHDDGTYRHIRSRSTTHGIDGVPVCKVGVHIDMSNDALFQLAKLSEANERLLHYSYMASHDLRSPLRAVRGLISCISEDHGPSLPTEVLGLLCEIEKRTERLDRLLIDMLDFATADAEATAPEPTDVARLLAEVVDTTDHRQCRIVVSSSVDGAVQLTANPLAVCLRNLLDNACKHHDQPSGTVTISAERDGPWLQITIADDGPGISSTIRDHVYEPFRTTDREGSSGLGLAHVRQQVEKYGGSIAIATDPGTGTSVTLRWPDSAVGRFDPETGAVGDDH